MLNLKRRNVNKILIIGVVNSFSRKYLEHFQPLNPYPQAFRAENDFNLNWNVCEFIRGKFKILRLIETIESWMGKQSFLF